LAKTVFIGLIFLVRSPNSLFPDPNIFTFFKAYFLRHPSSHALFPFLSAFVPGQVLPILLDLLQW
jgi:hypothetical protein